MLIKTPYNIDKDILKSSILELPNINFRFTFNQPTGNFFYDSWEIKPEFNNTIWHTILKTLPFSYGEARLIRLDPGKCYVSHSDIDDRYHLNILGDKSYLIDLDNQQMYPLISDGCWYEMDASPRHTAANFGQRERIQLVVRKLLQHNNLNVRTGVMLKSTILDLEDRRFEFDDSISCWLSRANKRGIIDNFNPDKEHISFDIENEYIEELKNYLPKGFFLEIT